MALAVPILPGGAGVIIKASRAAQTTVKGLQTVDRSINAGMAVANAYVEYTQGNYGWAALNAGFAVLGAKGAYESATGVRAAWKATPAVPDPLKTMQRQGDQIAEVIGEGNDEVADLVKPRPRFIGDADGNVKDLSTGRGNQNTIGKDTEPHQLHSSSKEADRVLIEMEQNAAHLDAHYRGRQGAQTTLQQQYDRAVNELIQLLVYNEEGQMGL